jgi:ATP-dependent HslUV protease ATP-binding subunit HslU
MIGPTGVGKTEIARRLARLAQAPFIKVEASKFTEVGYVGRDVESMVRDLVELSISMVRTAQAEEVKEKAAQLAEERLLDILLPLPKGGLRERAVTDPAPATPEEGESQVPPEEDDAHRFQRTRERLREQLRQGKLDSRVVEIDVDSRPMAPLSVFAVGGVEEMNLAEAFDSLLPHRRKRRRAEVAQARAILTQEETEKLIDMDQAISEGLERVQENGIIFIDEIDKIAGSHAGTGPEVSREGVQRDLLPIIEGSTVTTKYGMVKTDHILFIAAGAFHESRPSDLIPELQGRLPIRVELSPLTEEDFVRILLEPQNALIKQYKALLETEGVEVEFRAEAVRRIAGIAASVNEETENIGARRLHTVLTTLLEDLLFDAPDTASRTVIIDEEMVERRLRPIAGSKDLSRFIL